MNKFLVVDDTKSNINSLTSSLNNLSEDAFFRDGSREMQGNIELGNNSLAGGINIVLENQASATNPPAGSLKLFSKNDEKLYIRDNAGNETDLTSGGGVSIDTSGTVNGVTLSVSPDPITDTGTITLGGSLSVNDSDWSGTDLSIGNGGTGQSTAQSAINSLSAVSGASVDEVLVKSGANAVWGETVKSVDTSGSVNGLTLTGGPITTIGTVALGGTLAVSNSDWIGTSLSIANGGTGESTAQDAINSLSNVTGASVDDVLVKTGSDAVWSGNYVRHNTTSTDNRIALFDGTTGKILKQSSEFSIDESDSDKLIFKYGNDSLMVPAMDFGNCFYGRNTGKLLPGADFDIQNNTLIGKDCVIGAATGTVKQNTAVGFNSLNVLEDGNENTSVGSQSLLLLTNGEKNNSFGMQSLKSITTGSRNIGIGYSAGSLYTSSESNNILIGDSVSGTTGESDVIRIGNTQTNTFIKGITNKNALSVWSPVRVSNTGELGINQHGYASYYFSNNETETTGSEDVYSVIAGTRTAHLSTSNFTVDVVSPDIEYIGTENVICRISVSANWSNEDNSNNYCRIAVHKNDAVQNNLLQRSNLSSGNDYPRNVSLSGFLALETNDKINVKVMNEESSSDDILVSFFNLNISII